MAMSEGVDRPIEAGMSLDLADWRQRLLNGMLFAAAGLGLPAVISGSLTTLRDGQLARIGVFGVVYIFVLVMALARRRIPFTIRASTLLAITFALGLDSLRSTGLGGSGRLFLIAFPLIATVFFGLRTGLITLALSVLSTAGVAYGMSTGMLPIGPEIVASTDPQAWITGGLVFTLLAAMLVVSLAILQRGLGQSLAGQRRMVREMEQQQELLEQRVAERTAELQRQSQQLEATAEIARLAAEAEDLDQLLTRAIELIRSRFGFYHSSVFLLDESGAWAEVAASTGEAGQLLLARRHRLAVGSASIVGWVTANRMPRISADVDEDPFHFRNPALPDTRSEMAVPLMVGQRLIGALDLQSTESNAFSDAYVRAIEAIASELAFAIDNTRLSEARREQMEVLEGEVRERIRDSWSEYARSGGPSIIHVGSGGTGISGAAFQDLSETARRGQTYVSPDKTEVVVPVRVRGETIAAIAARKPEGAGEWTDDDVALIESVAGQAALALETARQYAEEQRRVAELEVVNRVSQAASQLLRLDTLLRMVGRQIHSVLERTDVSIGLYEEQDGTLRFPYVLDHGEEIEREPRSANAGLEGVIVRTRQPLLISERVERQAAELGVRVLDSAPRSWLGVPMLVGDQLIGVITAQDPDRERRYNDDDVALLSTVAGQLATAIQNARLLDQVQRAARRERLIHDISSKVRQSPDIETVLETTAREVGRALNATRTSVRLGHPSEDEEKQATRQRGDGAEAEGGLE